MMASIAFHVDDDVPRDLEGIAARHGMSLDELVRNCVASTLDSGLLDADLAQHARRYAAGAASWRDIRDATGATFGDLLVELATQGLQLPQVRVQRTPEQQRAFEEILTRAAQHGPERQR
jgi:hypothetical protein